MSSKRSQEILDEIEKFIKTCDTIIEEIIENISSTNKEIENRKIERKKRDSN